MSSFNVGFVIFPDLTQLDFTGPLQVLARLPQSAIHIIAKSEAPVPSDCGLSLVPTCTFVNCPPLDLICIPGGVSGVIKAIGDRETVEFVRQQAGAAKYVTSVCTGAFILGVAGLLEGRRATTHWAYTALLPLVGATYEKARIVKDGNVITAGGVTAGIDFGLSVVAEGDRPIHDHPHGLGVPMMIAANAICCCRAIEHDQIATTAKPISRCRSWFWC